MNLKKTALMMVLWLLCQQAGAITLAFNNVAPVLEDPGINSQASCHDKNNADSFSDEASVVHHHGDVSSKAKPSTMTNQACCDVSCQCCIGGCLSVINHVFDRTLVLLDYQSFSLNLFAVLQAPAQSLFRPPIVV
jgi:hypothetical protein